MKYMVMECHPSYAVVLSADGRFLKVANMHYQVGQTVTDVVEMRLPQTQVQPARKTNRRWIPTLAAMAACLVLVVTSVFITGQMPYASVYMTINPEVRIDVNRSDVVVGVEGMNTDGQTLLVDYDYKRKDLDLVMDELVDRAIDMGYLHEGGKITLTLDADDNEWVTTHSDTLTHQLNDYLTEKISVTIDLTPARPSTAPTGQSVVIPVGPDSDYGDSAYGSGDEQNDNDGDSAYGSGDEQNDNDGDSGYSAGSDDDGQSSYDSDDGDSGYTSGGEDDGQTDYGVSSDDGQSDYEPPSSNSASGNDGQSNYDNDDGQSNYGSDDSQSNYDDSAYYG